MFVVEEPFLKGGLGRGIRSPFHINTMLLVLRAV